MTQRARVPKILLIDDNLVDRELTKLMLEEHGFLVVAKASAKDCVTTITTENPDLVILDIMMPDMDGTQALQLIRNQHSQIELPVIMVTSKSDASDIIDALKSGANDFISKPVQFEVALKRIDTHLTLALQAQTMAHAKELAAIQASIATYNHELNNPLSIALTNVSFLKDKYGSEPQVAKLETVLWRISEIVKKTGELLEKSSVEYKAYTKTSKMLDL